MAEEKEKPLTREDVLKAIEDNGGTAKGLDLSGKVFEVGIDLSRIDLGNVILQDTFLAEANFQGVLMPNADLRGAFLVSANFHGASLWFADLEGAYLSHAKLNDAMLDEIKWGPQYIMGEEIARDFIHAKEVYRRLKNCHQQVGMYDIAGKFFYREMEIKRKAQSWKKPHLKLWSWVMRMLCGYGEKPERVVTWAAVVIFGLAAAYYFWGSFTSSSFWDTLYYSAASFTALGYGSWAPQPTGWAKGMGAVEAIIGVFSIALFLITFTRKMTR